MIKIGATDCGEPCFNLSWVDKLKDVDGAVIISKGLGHGSSEFKNALLDNKEKIIFHCTITGLGGTNVEPNVPDYMCTLNYLDELISLGFPSDHIVIRIDPIIGERLFNQCRTDDAKHPPFRHPTKYKYIINNIINFSGKFGITRFRYSFLDLYLHVRTRFENLGFIVPNWAMDFDEIKSWLEFFSDIETDNLNIKFESCAERFAPKHHQVGCISRRDFEILGLDPNECQGKCYQRKTCLCSGNKVELLPYMNNCPHKCLYCYIKDY